jgi:hypothetical protein
MPSQTFTINQLTMQWQFMHIFNVLNAKRLILVGEKVAQI